MTYHKTTIVGRLGRRPDMRYTPNGDPVTTFSVAVDSGYGDNKKTVWYKVSVWGKQAESCNTYLDKGREVLVEGELQGDPSTGGPKVWTDKQGQPRASFELRAYTVKFLGGGRNEATADETPAAGGDIPF